MRGNDRSGHVHRSGQDVRSGQTESDRRAVRGDDWSGQTEPNRKAVRGDDRSGQVHR